MHVMGLLRTLSKNSITISIILIVLLQVYCSNPMETPANPINPIKAQDQWEMKQISSQYRINNIIIADGRNDGIQRIYGASFDGGVYEWSYDQETSNWLETECLFITEDANGIGLAFYGLQAGNGQNDNKTRLYGANGNGYIYEFYYNNGSKAWDIMKLDDGGNYQPQGVLVGDTRNDGVNHVLSCATRIGELPRVQEYTWIDNNNYVLASMVNQYRELFQGAMGDARNDGTNYIYHPDATNNYLREYKWTGNSYVENNIALPVSAQRITIGDIHNDGVNRLYVSDGFYGAGTSYIREFTFDGNSWVEDVLHSSICPANTRHELFIGDARNDKTNRLYSIARDGDLVEHSYTNSEWETEAIDAVSGATATIVIGDARNDSTNRIYVAGKSKLLEYTYKSTTEKSVNVRNSPNPSN